MSSNALLLKYIYLAICTSWSLTFDMFREMYNTNSLLIGHIMQSSLLPPPQKKKNKIKKINK